MLMLRSCTGRWSYGNGSGGGIVASILLQLFLIITTIKVDLVQSSFCPTRCKCNEVELLVFCNNTQIDLVPIMLNPQLKELYLNGNRIKSIYSSFIVYQDLNYLDISNNQIFDIGKKSFVMQKKLRILLLNGNNLTEINNLSFYGLDSLYFLNLSNNNLVSLPNRVFMSLNKLETLDLSSNHISSIHKEAFFGLLNLKRLNLFNNLLKQIPTQSLYHLQSLLKLNIGKNMFTQIPELAFSPTTMLEELMIDSCFISAIHSRAFIHLSRLHYLDLQNNRLEYVPTESLCHVTTLKTLNLSHNLIKELNRNTFQNLTLLQTLIISSSLLSHIDKDAFIDNVNLKKLVMENNKKLNRIMTNTFARQQNSLEYLSLRANMISFIEWQTINLNRLQYIDLQQNPLVCNCSLSWLVSYLKRSSSLTQSNKEQVKCYFPSHMYGKKLITLSETDLSCSKLNSPIIIQMIVNIFTYTALLILIITLVIVVYRRRHKLCPCWCCRKSKPMTPTTETHCIPPNIDHLHSQHQHLYQQYHQHPYQQQHQIPKPRMRKETNNNETFYYYPTIINDELTRDKHNGPNNNNANINYRTMTTINNNSNNSTRTSALSVDLHPIPHRYMPIAHI